MLVPVLLSIFVSLCVVFDLAPSLQVGRRSAHAARPGAQLAGGRGAPGVCQRGHVGPGAALRPRAPGGPTLCAGALTGGDGQGGHLLLHAPYIRLFT